MRYKTVNMKTLASVTILLLSISLFAQKADTLLIEPGSNHIDGSFIENYTNKWQVSFIDLDGNETPYRVWTDYGETVELGGKTYLHRVQDIYTSELVHFDTWVNLIEKTSLRPWQFYTMNSSGGNSFYQFSDTVLIINSNKNNDKTQKSDTIKLDRAVFDWNLYGMLLVGLPFEKGAVYKLPYYKPAKQKIEYLVVDIEGEEEVLNLSGNKVKTWRARCSDGLTFWLTKSPPYVIQLELPISNKGKTFWNSY